MHKSRNTGGFLQFVLVIVGISCVVAGIWNVPRQRESERLEAEIDALGREYNRLQSQRHHYRRADAAFRNDPHYREGMIRQISRERLEGEMTIDEWLRERRRRAEP